nr:MAG TPA: hypothetical protein [Caudoviricetes sp.]
MVAGVRYVSISVGHTIICYMALRGRLCNA